MVSNRWFRQHQKKIFGALVVILMVTWSMGAAIRGILERSVQKGDGVIFGEKVKAEHVRTVAYHLNVWAPQRYTTGERTAIADAWEHLVFLHEAKRLGLTVTDAEVAEWLKMWYQIRFRAQFGVAQYQQYLSRYQVAPADFEATVRDLVLVDKLQSMQAQAAKVSDEEAWQWYRFQNDRLKARYASLSADALAPYVEVTEEALKKFHEQWMPVFPTDAPYGHGYRVPENVKVEYLLASTDKYLNEVVVTERDVQSYYDANKWRYMESQPGAEETKFKPLEDVRDSIERTLRKQGAEEMANALMLRADEEIANRMKTTFGSRDVKTVSLKEIQKLFPDLRWGQTGFFDKNSIPPELAGAEDLAEEAFGKGTSALNVPSRPMECAEGVLIFQNTELEREHASDFADVRDKVEKDYRLAEGRKLAEKILADAAKAAEGDFEKALDSVKAKLAELSDGKAKPDDVVKTGESRFMQRPQKDGDEVHAYDTGLGADLGAFAQKAFALDSGALGVVLEEQDNGVAYLLSPVERQHADRAAFDAGSDRTLAAALSAKRQAVIKAFVDDVRRRANPSEEVREILNWDDLDGKEG